MVYMGVRVCLCFQVNWQQERFQEIVSKLGHFLKQAGFKVMQSLHMEDVYMFFPLCHLYFGNFPPHCFVLLSFKCMSFLLVLQDKVNVYLINDTYPETAIQT